MTSQNKCLVSEGVRLCKAATGLTSVLLVAVLLAACGGGGGGGTPPALTTAPAAPTPTLGFSIKTLQFSWPAVSGATYYRLYENPDGGSGYTQVGGDLTTTSVNHTIFLPRRLNALYIVAACNSAGCTASAPIELSVVVSFDNLAQAIGYFKASNTGANDEFGYTLALSADGNTLAVGTPGEASNAIGVDGNQTDNSVPDSGAVYVYTRSGGAWSQQAYVKASNTGVNDRFGAVLALSSDGNTLAVGAPGETSSATGINGNQADNSVNNAGAVYVFTRRTIVIAGQPFWEQQAYVKASNTGAGDSFGSALALSADGTTLAVGASGEASIATGVNNTIPGQADNSAPNAGAVYVFSRGITISGQPFWSQQAYVKASNTGSSDPFTGHNDNFGSGVALSADGNTLAVGAPNEGSSATGIDGNQGDNIAAYSGAVYVFIRGGTTWSQQAYVKASNTGANDGFGSVLALAGDGNTLAVGAWGEASSATDIGGNEADNSAAGAGAVYVFTRRTIVIAGQPFWEQQAYVKASNTGAFDRFGSVLALSADGATLAVGAYAEASAATGINGDQLDNSANAAGAVYVFSRGITISGQPFWSQQAYVKASNTGVDDYFGFALALSADGATLAVGAYAEDSAATGIGGNQFDNTAANSGAVYLY